MNAKLSGWQGSRSRSVNGNGNNSAVFSGRLQD